LINALQRATVEHENTKNMQSLLNLISRKTNGRSFAFNLSAKGDIEDFMAQLKKAAADKHI